MSNAKRRHRRRRRKGMASDWFYADIRGTLVLMNPRFRRLVTGKRRGLVRMLAALFRRDPEAMVMPAKPWPFGPSSK